MLRNRVAVLEQEREKLLNQWTKNEGNKVNLLVRIMELEEQIEAMKKGA
ncbi:MAG TPA: chromosome segregation protein SMC [Thermoanaerobacterales bacterium]|nr:chromosome segregation protein SMC [Thermoanaerobacterales bacterium]